MWKSRKHEMGQPGQRELPDGAALAGLALAALLALPAPISAALFTVSKDGRGAFSTIQAAVEKAGKGDVVEILDAATYPEQVTIDSTRHGLTLRSSNPGSVKKPTISFKDQIHQNPKSCADALNQGKIDFDQNGALRLIRVRNVTVDGIAVDGGGSAPFAWPGVWGNGENCNGQLYPLFHGNGGIAVYLSGSITVRRCDIANAFFGIAVKDRNEGGVFANFNPADLEKFNIVPLSGFGRTGNHLFEKNRIHNNVWGLYFESLWDLGSTVRFNLIYENHHATPAAATAVKAMPDGEHHPGGGFLFKDAMLSPVAIHNNTFWHDFTLFSGGYRPGAQHLVFNNIYAAPYQYYSQNVYQNPFHILDPFFVHRMKHCLYAAQTEAPKSDIQNVQAQLFDPATNKQVIKDSTVPIQRSVRIMNGMGNVVQDSFTVNLVLPMSSGPVTVPRIINGVNLPGGIVGGAGTAPFPLAADIRWLEIAFKSVDPASPDFLSPDWEDPLVKKLVLNAGWPEAGIYNADGKVADIGAVPSAGLHADDVLIRPLGPVILNGTSATLTFDLAPVQGSLFAPRIKYIRLVKSLPVNPNGFGGAATLIVPAPSDVTPSTTSLKMGANTLTVTGFPALAASESYAFFEIIAEGTAANGKLATTNVGFIPYRKLDYKFLVEILDASGAKTATVKVGEAVRLRITPQRLDGTAFSNAITPVEINLNSGADLLLPGNPPVKLALAKVEGPTISPIMFTKVPPGGSEYVTVSGIWKNGTNTLAFYGVSDGVLILPGDPEKVLFQDPPSKILSPGSAPVIDPGQGYAVKVQVQDRFGNPVTAPAQVSIKSNHPLIGDIDGAAIAATDSNGIAVFKAKVTQGDLNEIFELEALLAGKSPDRADLKVGQPRDRLWILYSDIAAYNPDLELRGAAGSRLAVTIRAGKTADLKLADRSTAFRIEASSGLAVYSSPTDPAPRDSFSLVAGEAVIYVTGLKAVENGTLTAGPVSDNTILPGSRSRIYFTFSADAVQSASAHADNGFGRVDRIEIRFASDLKRPPDSIAIAWPAAGQDVRMVKSGIALDPANPRQVTVRLAEPFPAGITTYSGSNSLGIVHTSNPATPEIPPQALAFGVSDSVGPLIDSARVRERFNPGADTLWVSFSERLAAGTLAGASLVLLKQGGSAPITLAILSASDLAEGRRFRLAVADLGANAPAEGDSLKISPWGPVTDAHGNLAHALNRPVPLGLKSVPKPPVLNVWLDRPLTGSMDSMRPSDFLVLAPAVDSSLTPVLGSTRDGKAADCNQVQCGGVVPMGVGIGGPSLTVETDRALKFSLSVFTNLGGFVNSFSGEITNAQLGLDEKGLPAVGAAPAFRKDARGRYVIRLAWNTRAHDRSAAGTGAYLAKVSLASRAEEADGKSVTVNQSRTVRFGILR